MRPPPRVLIRSHRDLGLACLAGDAKPTAFLLKEVRQKLEDFLGPDGKLRKLLTSAAKDAGYQHQVRVVAPTVIE